MKLVSVILGTTLASSLPIAALAGTLSYGYDSLGRVISVNYPNGRTVTYTYDPAGNRTQFASSQPGARSSAQTASASGQPALASPTPNMAINSKAFDVPAPAPIKSRELTAAEKALD